MGMITYRNFVPAKIPYWISQFAEKKDLEKFKEKEYLREFQTNQLSYLLPFKALDIMTPNPIVIESNEDVSKVVLLMIRHEISGIPVVKKSKLVGIVTKSDIVNAIAEK